MVNETPQDGNVFRGHQCDSPIRVEVGDIGIPIISDGVTLHERKDGPTSITRRAEVTFPIKGFGETWTDYIDAYSVGSANGMAPATVYGTPINIDGDQYGEERPLFRGYVGAVGSNEGANEGRFHIYDPAKFLTRIPAGVTFNHARVTDVLRWIRDTFAEEQSVFDRVDIVGIEEYEPTQPFYARLFDIDNRALRSVLDIPSDGIITKGFGKSFSTNRDSLADVVQWVQQTGGIYVWFDVTSEGLELRVTDNPVRGAYDATADGDVPLIENNALYEMRPFNTLVLKGETGHSIDAGALEDIGTQIDNTYPEAEASYPPLVERAGGKIPIALLSQANSEAAIGHEAKRRLKEELDVTSGGDMTLALTPMIRPYDTITAKPACEGQLNIEVDALTYEVQRTAHQLTPNDTNVPRTEVAVSMEVDPSKITVDTKTKTAQPTKGSENTPPEKSGWDNLEWGI